MKQPPKLPLVSIITPVYNGAKYLDTLIISVLNQSYSRVEHLIIDDGSDDQGATKQILGKYPHLRWWSRENFGQYPTMNEGLKAASGDIICFISADDVMAENAIQLAVEYLLQHPNADGVYGQYSYIDEENLRYWYQPLIKHAPLGFYRYSPFIAHCSLYITKEELVQHELFFNTGLRYVGDYDWIVRIIQAGLRIGYLKNNLSMVRWHTEQTSVKHINTIKDELFSTHKTFGVNTFIYRVFNVAIDRILFSTRLVSLFFSRQPQKELEQIRAWRKSKKGK